MKFKTTSAYKKGTRRYNILARNTNKALKAWRKEYPEYKIVDVSRQIYRGYATLGITFKDSRGATNWVNVFCCQKSSFM